MILLLGNSDDVLVSTVNSLLVSQGRPVRCVCEAYLFSKLPFAFEQRGDKFSGSILLDDQEIQLNDLSGVFVRLSRKWTPPPDFDLQDQVFIFHESGASWFALLAGLQCKMVNRPALGAWVQDISYPETLASSLAQRLGIALCHQFASATNFTCTFPTAPSEHSSSTSFYAVDGKLIPRSVDGEALTRRLARETLHQWQYEQGVSFCRFDFECECDVPRLVRVETHPVLNQEPIAVVEKVAVAITEVLA